MNQIYSRDSREQQSERLPARGNKHSPSDGAETYNQASPEELDQNPLTTQASTLSADLSYCVPEKNNPGVAPFKANPIPFEYSQELLQRDSSTSSRDLRAITVYQELCYACRTARAVARGHPSGSLPEQQPIMQFQELAYNPAQYQYHSSTPQNGEWHDNVTNQPLINAIGRTQAYHDALVSQSPWIRDMDNFKEILW